MLKNKKFESALFLREINKKLKDTLTQPARVTRLRIALYIFTIALQSVNGVLTLVWTLRIIDEEPDIQFYFFLSPRFFSVWTIVMHVMNAALGIICFQNVYNYTKKQEKYIIQLRSFKKIFFCAIVWPSSWVCFAYFWFFYHYDKNLLKFHTLMKIGYPLNNHIEHTYIILAALLEVVLQSGSVPKSHKRNVLYGFAVVIFYFLVLCYTYVTSGTWLYPFYDLSYGTIYFPLLHFMTLVITVVSYYAQWFIPRIKNHSLKELLSNFSTQKKLKFK